MCDQRQHFGKALHGGGPHLRLALDWFGFATGYRHRASLHLVVAGSADLQRLHGFDPLSFRTASTSFQKSSRSVAASSYWYGRIDRNRCRWSLSPRRRVPLPFPDRVRIVETDQPGPLRRMPRERIAEPVGPCRRRTRSQYDELDPVSYLVEERVWP